MGGGNEGEKQKQKQRERGRELLVYSSMTLIVRGWATPKPRGRNPLTVP